MLTVRTYVAPSPIHGLGLFAAEHIIRGAVVWLFDVRFDQTFRSMSDLPESLQRYAFRLHANTKQVCLSADDDRFTNHSDNPNVYWDADNRRAIAIRSIRSGEEITQNYKEFGEDAPGRED